MTTRIVLILAVAIMVGPSLAFGSSACMTESEAHTKFPKSHLYWHGGEHCWDDSPPGHTSHTLAAEPVHSPRHPASTAVPTPSARPALAVDPVPSRGPKTLNGGTDTTGARCQYSPCE